MDNERKVRRTRVGVVVSDKMDKTVVVSVEQTDRHPLYGKTLRRSATFKAHDELNECGTGDRVRIMQTRPISKQKRWRVTEVIEKAR